MKMEVEGSSVSALEEVNNPKKPIDSTKLPGGKSKQLRPLHQLQLFNPAHRKELVSVFQGLRKFRLVEADGGCEEAEIEEDSNLTEKNVHVHDETKDISTEADLEEVEDGEINDEAAIQDEGRLACTTCCSSFRSLDEHRRHYRLDWHRYNVKRRAHGQPAVSDIEFDEIIDGLSSISGSDTEDDETNSSTATTMATMAKLMNKITLEIPLGDIDPIDNRVQRQSKAERKLKGSPKLFFENSDGNIVMIYKAVLKSEVVSPEEDTFESNVDLASQFLSGTVPKWAVIMLSGGHFAAVIVSGGVEVRRKTFHSYTVRAKQGGGQSSRDAKGGNSHPKSAGASLRRYNEASFSQHIQELLESWKADLDECEWIFYRALSFNEKVLFSGKCPPLSRNNTKLRTIPFPTKRPTNSEVKRVVSFLSAVQVFTKEDFFSQFLIVKANKPSNSTTESGSSPIKSKKSKKSAVNIDRARSRSPKKRDEPERPSTTPEDTDPEPDTFILEEVDEEIDLTDLAEYGDSFTNEERAKPINLRKPRSRPARLKPCKEEFPKPTGVVVELWKALECTDRSSSFILSILETVQPENGAVELNQVVNEENTTILHLATTYNLADVIWRLLELGSNPALKDKAGKYPYNFAEAKECRLIFRKFRASFPDKYDYHKGQIPEPLTEEMEKQKAEKKALLNKLKREKEKQKKTEQFEKKKETEEKDRFLNLSDREKRALAAEQRVLGKCKKDGEKKPILVRCFDCGIDITGKVPFEYNKNVFCTPKCLAAHRKKFPMPLTA